MLAFAVFLVSVVGSADQALLHGRVYRGGADGVLYATRITSGRVEWRRDLRAPITTPVIAVGPALFVGTADGAMYRVEPSAGVVESSYRIGGSLIPRRLVVAGESLLVHLFEGRETCRAVASLNLYLSERRADLPCPIDDANARRSQTPTAAR
jgi:outer membrane protein assembly factor BamB